MSYSHEKINQLSGGWYAVYRNGEVYTQDDSSWYKLSNKKDIQRMGLKWRNKCFEICDKTNYLSPGETYFRELGLQGAQLRVTPQELCERFIGYYDVDARVYYRVNVNTGILRIEREPY